MTWGYMDKPEASIKTETEEEEDININCEHEQGLCSHFLSLRFTKCDLHL